MYLVLEGGTGMVVGQCGETGVLGCCMRAGGGVLGRFQGGGIAKQADR